MSKEVRTRFAPSPTGFQHLGGMRTAFFAWLLAKKHGGQFLLRIEDTDRERSIPGAVRFILEEFKWFGLTVDEGPSPDELKQIGEWWDGAPTLSGGSGPYIQSLRVTRYKEIAEELVAKGAAYRCDCTSEMLEKERLEQMARKELPGYSGYCRTRNVSADVPHAIRLKLPTKRTISFVDAIRGRVSWDNMSLRDPVLLKTDGFPTYHLAVVVDDHDMRISHAIRGIEWLPSTPIHLLVYEALGWEPVTFAHLPVILGDDGKKLSKRHGAVKSDDLRNQGYIADAVMNFVTLVGWSPGEGVEQEIFTRKELIERFALEQITESSGVFDATKMLWMNGMYMRSLPLETFVDQAMPFIERAGLHLSKEIFTKIAAHVQERVKTFAEIPPMIDFLGLDKIERQLDAMFQKGMDKEKAKQVIERALSELTPMADFQPELIERALRAVAEGLGLKVGPAFVVLRVAVTGKTVTPPLFESFAVLGKDKVISRLQETLPLLN